MGNHIALILNNPDSREFYKKSLIEHGYKVSVYERGLEFINDNIFDKNIALLLCAYELEDIDGESLYKEISKQLPETPVIIIGNIRDVNIITRILTYPKCEFMVQPVAPAEVIARISAWLSPSTTQGEENEFIIVKDLKLNTSTKKAYRKNKAITLTPTEYRLLEYLMGNPGKVLSRDQILNRVWNTTEYVSDRVVDVYIGYLREKIDGDQKEKDKLIKTQTGFGYVLGS